MTANIDTANYKGFLAFKLCYGCLLTFGKLSLLFEAVFLEKIIRVIGGDSVNHN